MVKIVLMWNLTASYISIYMNKYDKFLHTYSSVSQIVQVVNTLCFKVWNKLYNFGANYKRVAQIVF